MVGTNTMPPAFRAAVIARELADKSDRDASFGPNLNRCDPAILPRLPHRLNCDARKQGPQGSIRRIGLEISRKITRQRRRVSAL